MKKVYYKTKYVSARIDVQFGIPCVRGTRIPCRTLFQMNQGGDNIKFLAEIFNLTTKQVKAAIIFFNKHKNKKAAPIREVLKYHKDFIALGKK